MADVLLSRYAECLFWLARYVERAENLARILDVNETFSRDSRGGQNWRSVLQLYGDEARFKEKHGEATAQAVLRFYVTDAANPTSIVSAVRLARENARALRPLISNEMWTQVNVLHNRLGALGGGALAAGNRVLMFEHAVYSVISPEGCASILWRTADKAAEAAEAMRVTAQDLKGFGVIDTIVPEPVGGAHRAPGAAIGALGDAIKAARRPVLYLTQWPLRREASCTDIDVAPPVDFANWRNAGF